jgi:hypothetical protein
MPGQDERLEVRTRVAVEAVTLFRFAGGGPSPGRATARKGKQILAANRLAYPGYA